jgi:hypothetical protein
MDSGLAGQRERPGMTVTNCRRDLGRLIKINAVAAVAGIFAVKGCAMNNASAAHRDDLDAVLAAVAVWVMKYRYALGIREEPMKCRPQEVAQRARDLGIAPDELASLASKGPESAAVLEKLLLALGVEPGRLTHGNPLIMRDLLRLCIDCVHRPRCEVDLADATTAENVRDYCPNAYTLDALLKGA